ncbi:hypothetical protein ACFVXC_35420 [Streptomyces sp. NPDC058257]|uniref:hypothetical protein n=1 Tax=unclassified Streptomyces TaxID=2593676 RepID=UPI00366487FC
MKLPVDDASLTAWSSLLGLTEEESEATVADIEQTLRVGYEHRPDELREKSFDELNSDLGADEVALMFLVSGLRQAGLPEAAYAIEVRGLAAALQSLQQTS